MFRRAAKQKATHLVIQAQYLWDERRRKVWIPFLERKVAMLQERIREKKSVEEACPSEA